MTVEVGFWCAFKTNKIRHGNCNELLFQNWVLAVEGKTSDYIIEEDWEEGKEEGIIENKYTNMIIVDST